MRVRLCCRPTSSGGSTLLLFYGALRDLSFDPGQWKWDGQVDFMKYSAILGRKLVNPTCELTRNVPQQVLPQKFQFIDSSGGKKELRRRKRAGFIWSVWHQAALAVNTWRAKVNQGIPTDCPSGCALETSGICCT
jgi:hypothetical protein